MLKTDSTTNYNPNFKASWYDKFFKSIPNKEVANSIKYNKMGKALASPHYNRLALGIGAITTQPLIDRYNPRVDDDIAKASSYRTFAKNITCTSVGFCVRGLCYKLTNKFANLSPKEGSVLLTPKAILKEKNPELQKSMLKLHKNSDHEHTLSPHHNIIRKLFNKKR